MSQNHPPSEYVTIPNECIIRHIVPYSALAIISCITTNTNIHAAACHARIIHILDILESVLFSKIITTAITMKKKEKTLLYVSV